MHIVSSYWYPWFRMAETVRFGVPQYEKYMSSEKGREHVTYSLYSKCLWTKNEDELGYLMRDFVVTFLKHVPGMTDAWTIVTDLYYEGKKNYEAQVTKNQESSSGPLSFEEEDNCAEVAKVSSALTCLPRTMHKQLYEGKLLPAYVFAHGATVFYASPAKPDRLTTLTPPARPPTGDPPRKWTSVFNGLCFEMQYRATNCASKKMKLNAVKRPGRANPIAYCTCSVDVDTLDHKGFTELKTSTLFLKSKDQLRKARPELPRRDDVALHRILRDEVATEHATDLLFGPTSNGELHIGFLQRPTTWLGERRPGPETTIEIYRYSHNWFAERNSFSDETKWDAYEQALEDVRCTVLEGTGRGPPKLLKLSYTTSAGFQVEDAVDEKAQAQMEAVCQAKQKLTTSTES